MADVLSMPLEYHPWSSGALGIAFLAGYAAGLVGDLSLINDRWLRGTQLHWPDPQACTVYDRAYASYCGFDRVLAGRFAQMALESEEVPATGT